MVTSSGPPEVLRLTFQRPTMGSTGGPGSDCEALPAVSKTMEQRIVTERPIPNFPIFPDIGIFSFEFEFVIASLQFEVGVPACKSPGQRCVLMSASSCILLFSSCRFFFRKGKRIGEAALWLGFMAGAPVFFFFFKNNWVGGLLH